MNLLQILSLVAAAIGFALYGAFTFRAEMLGWNTSEWFWTESVGGCALIRKNRTRANISLAAGFIWVGIFLSLPIVGA